MKKILLILTFLLSLSSCDFESRSDFEAEYNKKEELSENKTKAKITYLAASDEDKASKKSEDKSDIDKIDFAKYYGKGKVGEGLDPSDSLGNIEDTKISNKQIGISLLCSVQTQGAYSTFLSYNRNDQFVEREFGPIGGFEGLSSTVTYDIIDSESGPMLLVSQVSKSNRDTYSAYYLFNKFMGLIDYLVFENSVDNINPTVERLGDIIQAPEERTKGSVSEAIKARIETEKDHLPSLLDVYGVKTRPVVAEVDGKKIDIGYIPDIKKENRILLAKTTDDSKDQGSKVDIEN